MLSSCTLTHSKFSHTQSHTRQQGQSVWLPGSELSAAPPQPALLFFLFLSVTVVCGPAAALVMMSPRTHTLKHALTHTDRLGTLSDAHSYLILFCFDLVLLIAVCVCVRACGVVWNFSASMLANPLAGFLPCFIKNTRLGECNACSLKSP